MVSQLAGGPSRRNVILGFRPRIYRAARVAARWILGTSPRMTGMVRNLSSAIIPATSPRMTRDGKAGLASGVE